MPDVRPIDANALKSEIWDEMWESDISIAQLTVEHIYDLIDKQPTINPDDLRPRGRWELHGYDDDIGSSYFCSLCGWNEDEDEFLDKWSRMKFCPNCGAKMDGKEQK